MELANVISGSCPAADGFSNNKRSNGSNTHPLKSAILISRARSDTSVRKSPGKSLGKSPGKSPGQSPGKSLGFSGPAE